MPNRRTKEAFAAIRKQRINDMGGCLDVPLAQARFRAVGSHAKPAATTLTLDWKRLKRSMVHYGDPGNEE